MRLFVALRPPQDVLGHLDAGLGALGAAEAGTAGRRASDTLRWVPRGDRHVTLAFLGDVPGGRLTELLDGLIGVLADAHPFELRLSGAGVSDRRVLWLGLVGDLPALAALAERVADVASAAGAEPGRARRGHLTVARVRDSHGRRRPGHRVRSGLPEPSGGPGDLVRALSVYRGPSWVVRDAVLVESRLGAGPAGGPLYADVAVLPMASPGRGAADTRPDGSR